MRFRSLPNHQLRRKLETTNKSSIDRSIDRGARRVGICTGRDIPALKLSELRHVQLHATRKVPDNYSSGRANRTKSGMNHAVTRAKGLHARRRQKRGEILPPFLSAHGDGKRNGKREEDRRVSLVCSSRSSSGSLHQPVNPTPFFSRSAAAVASRYLDDG